MVIKRGVRDPPKVFRPEPSMELSSSDNGKTVDIAGFMWGWGGEDEELSFGHVRFAFL